MATPHCTDEKFEKTFSEFERQRLLKRMQEIRKQKKKRVKLLTLFTFHVEEQQQERVNNLHELKNKKEKMTNFFYVRKVLFAIFFFQQQR